MARAVLSKMAPSMIVVSSCTCGREELPRMWPRSYFVQLVRAIVFALALTHLLQLEIYATTSDESPTRPNIVLIMADDLGYGELGCYGGWIRTPHLDALASSGVRFTDFHSSGNVCSPTRAGLLTGRYQQRAGIPGVVFADPKRDVHYHGLQLQEVTFAEMLKSVGYSTAIFGKWHLGYERKYSPVHQGFDVFRGYVSGNVDYFSHVDQAGVYDWWSNDQPIHEDGYTTRLITKHAVRFIEQNRDRPFCLYLPHESPHSPYQGPGDKAERTVAGKFKTQGSRRDVKNAYREMVEELDKSVGEVVATIHRLGLEKKTLVIFISDNGANKNGSNQPLRGFKGSNWEGGHRVPAFAAWKGVIEPGRECDDLAISLDIAATLLEVARVEPPQERRLDGVSLLPLLHQGKQLESRRLFWNGRAMRDGDWKIIVDGKGQKGVGLYNLAKDMGEQENLASENPDRVRSMLAAIEEWKRDVAGGATPQPRGKAPARE